MSRCFHFSIVLLFLCPGCGNESAGKQTRTVYELTVAQKERAMQLLRERNLLTYEESPLAGYAIVDEAELLSLADATVKRDDVTYYVFYVPRHDRVAGYRGPWDEGDGGVTVEVRDGIIVQTRYVVYEF